MSGVPAFKLVEAGFSQPQVEALSEFLQTEAARRSDLEGAEHRLDSRIGEVEHKLDARVGDAEHRLEVKIADLQGTARLHNWMIGFNIALSLLILGKLFVH